jgi:hypothetical protein
MWNLIWDNVAPESIVIQKRLKGELLTQNLSALRRSGLAASFLGANSVAK